MRGRFITVEGIEGAGKSSNLDFLQSRLEAEGKTLVRTREPGGTLLGEELRALLLGHRDEGMDGSAELLLMFAARAEHLTRVIRPALERGDWVLCDRFTDATYAYQGGGRGLNMAMISRLEELVQGGLRPDLTLLLDLPVDIGLKRARARSAPDRFEQEKAVFFERVRKAYLEIAERQPGRIRRIDASQALNAVQMRIETVLRGFLNDVQ